MNWAEALPVIFLAPRDAVYGKIVSASSLKSYVGPSSTSMRHSAPHFGFTVPTKRRIRAASSGV